MADVLQTITSLAPGTPVYLVAHSMGNRVMLHGLAELLRRSPDAHQSLQQVVMAAPDVSVREFKNLITIDLAGTAPRYTLYADRHDLPVAVSEWLHGDHRLGDGGPGIAVFRGVDSIDASAISKEFFGLNHSYFGDTTSLVSDLFTLIHYGYGPSQRFRLKAVVATQGQYWKFMP
jgi:esterase/lipase superfamily enzyme